MKIAIYEDEIPIGEGNIFALDPPMGVAMATFQPLPAYDAIRHANVIEDEFVGDRGEILRVELVDAGEIKVQALSIQDFSSIDEIEIHLLGIIEPSFDSLFADHPDFKAYWGKS